MVFFLLEFNRLRIWSVSDRNLTYFRVFIKLIRSSQLSNVTISYLVIDLSSEKHNVCRVGQGTAERPERALRYPAFLQLQVGVGDQDHAHQRKPNRKYLK